MSDAVPLPPRPDLDHYRKLAKDLRHACEARSDGAIRAWAARWLDNLARLRGDAVPPGAIEREVERLLRQWKKAQFKNERGPSCLLADSQFFVARAHGFSSWPAFVGHIESLSRDDSPVSLFEQAADAIVRGDAARLSTLLREHPHIVRERSTRDHRSTLLHYVSANGIEDFRQQTPQNIVEITDLLLKAGADVNAESEAYGGGSTPLGLAATSIHPETAGVQIPLLETLLAHGARIDQPGLAGNGYGAIRGCLANGQGTAARFFAARGVAMALDEAAGVGRLDVVKEYYDEEGRPKAPVTHEQGEAGFLYACGYGHPDVVQFLLERGVDPGTRNKQDQTGLHWAMYGPHVEVVRILIRHGAPVNARDANDAPPIHWALGGWASTTDPREREGYEEVIAMLIDAGADPDLAHLGQHDRRHGITEKIHADEQMMSLLRR